MVPLTTHSASCISVDEVMWSVLAYKAVIKKKVILWHLLSSDHQADKTTCLSAWIIHLSLKQLCRVINVAQWLLYLSKTALGVWMPLWLLWLRTAFGAAGTPDIILQTQKSKKKKDKKLISAWKWTECCLFVT